MTEEVNAFNEHLEDTYNFTIEEGKTDGGERGSVIYGTMSAKDVGGGVRNKYSCGFKNVS